MIPKHIRILPSLLKRTTIRSLPMLTTALLERDEGTFDAIQVNVRFKNQDNTRLEFQLPNAKKWNQAQCMQYQNGITTFAEKDYTLSHRPMTINLPGKWGEVVYPHGIVIFVKEHFKGASEQEVVEAWQACASAATMNDVDVNALHDDATDDELEFELMIDEVAQKESYSSEYDDSENDYDSEVSSEHDAVVDETWTSSDVGSAL